MNREKLLWDLQYTFCPHTDSWYSKLFNHDSVSGDITPKYCELSESDILEIKKIYGNLKIVITVRDPIERDWSRAKMNLCKAHKKKPSQISHSQWIDHFNQPDQAYANDYNALYNRWSKVFGRENIHLIFFDEIEKDAWQVFTELCCFLELKQLPKTYKSNIIRPVGTGIKNDIPEVYSQYLLSKHREKILHFSEAFPNQAYSRQWINKYDKKTDNS